jgi:hypothetical protein
MSDDQSEQPNGNETDKPFTREDIEQSRAEETDAKLDKLVGLSQKTRQDRIVGEDGNIYTSSVLELVPPADGYSVLKNSGYSRVKIGRSTTLSEDNQPIYPWVTVVETYDIDGMEKELFFLMQSADKMRIMVGDEEAGSRPVGIDAETGEATTDVMNFDPEHASGMLPTKLRLLEGSEYANLRAIIIACEADDR